MLNELMAGLVKSIWLWLPITLFVGYCAILEIKAERK